MKPFSNRSLRSWSLPISAIFSLCLIAHLYPKNLAAKRIVNRTLLVVNGEPLLESDLKRFQEQLKSKNYQELSGGLDEKVLKDREAVLQLLLDETLINQQVKKLEMTASEKEIEGQIRSIAKRNQITTKELAQRLKQLGTQMSEYRTAIKRQIERNNFIEREIRPTVELSQDQVEKFYQELLQGAGKNEEYHIAHIFVAPKNGDWKAANQRANTVYEEVHRAEEKFEELCKEYSDDSSTATSGGDLGFVSPSKIDANLKAAVYKLKKGEISKPVRTKGGFHIVRVLDIRKPQFSSLPKDEQEKIQSVVYAQSIQKRVEMWLERRKRESHIYRPKDVSSETKSENI